MTSGDIMTDCDPPPTLQIEADRAFDLRIEEELEKINIAIREISQLNKQYNIVRASYRSLYNRAKLKCDKLYRHNKNAIEMTRTFFDAKAEALKAKDDLIAAAARFRSASVHFEEARENAATAEKAFLSQMSSICEGTQDPEVLSNLNKANEKVQEASRIKSQAFEEQQRRMQILSEADHKVALLGATNNKIVLRAQPYYETRDVLQKELDGELGRLKEHYATLKESKTRYKSTFDRLHVISAEFEQRREISDLERNFSDLSRFEEIDDIQSDNDFEKDILQTNYNLEVLSRDSVFSDVSHESKSSELKDIHPPPYNVVCESSMDMATFSDDLLEDDSPDIPVYPHGSLELQL